MPKDENSGEAPARPCHDTPQFNGRFLREAREAAAVRHGNIVDVFAVEEERLPLLVMECIPGITLQPLKTGSIGQDHPESSANRRYQNGRVFGSKPVSGRARAMDFASQ